MYIHFVPVVKTIYIVMTLKFLSSVLNFSMWLQIKVIPYKKTENESYCASKTKSLFVDFVQKLIGRVESDRFLCCGRELSCLEE